MRINGPGIGGYGFRNVDRFERVAGNQPGLRSEAESRLEHRRSQQEAVALASLVVLPHNAAASIDPEGGGRDSTREIKLRVVTRAQQEAMGSAAPVDPNDVASRSDPGGESERTPRNIERRCAAPVWSENWICMKMRCFATAVRRTR